MNFSNFSDSELLEMHRSKVSRRPIYVGSPTHITWMDYVDGDNRGWFILDTSDNSLSIVKNAVDETLFCVYDYDQTKSIDDMDLSVLEGKICRVVVKDNSDTKKYNKFLQKLKDVKVIECKIVDHTIVRQENKDSIAKVDISMIATDMSATFVDYVGQLAGTVTGADVEYTKTLAKEIFINSHNS